MRKQISYIFVILASIGAILCFSEPTWEIPRRDREILIDGFLQEWEGVRGIRLVPGDGTLKSGGTLSEDDVSLDLQGLWDEQYLYLAIKWIDNTWDIKEIGRKDAVWVDSANRRRDRMYLFDNLKFHIRTSDYDYTLWLSPRINDEGPFVWARLLEGYKGMERATSTPMVSARHLDDSTVSMEVVLLWEQLRLEPGEKFDMPLTLVLSDGDHPGRMLDYKVDLLKWLGWVGRIRTPL